MKGSILRNNAICVRALPVQKSNSRPPNTKQKSTGNANFIAQTKYMTIVIRVVVTNITVATAVSEVEGGGT